MGLGEKNSLRHRTRQVLLKGRQDLDSQSQTPVDLIVRNHLARRQTNLFTPISPSAWNQVASVRGSPNQLLGIANPSTATTFGGLVVGGVPLVGDFYPTATPLATGAPSSPRPANSQTIAGNIRPTPSSSFPPSSRLPMSTGTTQPPRSTGPTPLGSSTPSGSFIPPMVSAPPFDSSMNARDSFESTTISGGVVAGIVVAALLLLLAVILGCWYFLVLRRRKLEQKRKQTDSFLRNPIVNSLIVPNTSSLDFRGTPYPGEEGDMYYAGPPSAVSERNSGFGHSFRFSHRPQLEPIDDSDLNEVNYLKVTGIQSRMDSLPLVKNYGTAPLRLNSPHRAYLQPLDNFTRNADQKFGQRVNSELSHDSQSFGTHHSSFASPFSAGSLVFPQVAMFRTGPKNEAGIPIQNLEANRIISQVATGVRVSFDERDQASESGHFESEKVQEGFLPFYLPRAGDPDKIIYDRVEPNQTSAIPTTNFSYPMPRVAYNASPPELSCPMEVQEDIGLAESTATPSFPTNRYIPNKGRKTKQNAKVMSILHKSSLRKSASKGLSMSKRQSASRRASRAKIFSVNSIDVPDPYGQDYFG